MMNRSLLTIVEIVIYLKWCLLAQRPTFVLTEIESCVNARIKTRNPEINKLQAFHFRSSNNYIMLLYIFIHSKHGMSKQTSK